MRPASSWYICIFLTHTQAFSPSLHPFLSCCKEESLTRLFLSSGFVPGACASKGGLERVFLSSSFSFGLYHIFSHLKRAVLITILETSAQPKSSSVDGSISLTTDASLSQVGAVRSFESSPPPLIARKTSPILDSNSSFPYTYRRRPQTRGGARIQTAVRGQSGPLNVPKFPCRQCAARDRIRCRMRGCCKRS